MRGAPMSVKFSVASLEETAKNRPDGYLADVLSKGTVVSDHLVLDRRDYEALLDKYRPSGPGRELKKLLSSLGFKAAPGCKCNKRARYMDKMGCDWCEQNVDQIVGWLREEHDRQKSVIPFVPLAVQQLAKLAIRRARKKATHK